MAGDVGERTIFVRLFFYGITKQMNIQMASEFAERRKTFAANY
jgi:hypothetical protein